MKNVFRVCLCCCLSMNTWANGPDIPYKNPKIAIEQRVEDLLGRMTLEEKVEQLNMKSLESLEFDEKARSQRLPLKSFLVEGASAVWKALSSSMKRLRHILKRQIVICANIPVWAFLPYR